MKILTITTLFPNRADPKLGIFVETRMKHFKEKYPEASLTVIAPIPWFPFTSSRFGNYATFAKAPRSETRIGSDVFHPRYLVIPKVGMLLTPFFLSFALLLSLWKLKRQGNEFDLVDGHYLYPDGVAIALCSLFMKTPFVLTARGTDLNLIPAYRLPRCLIRWACGKASALITVCEALRQAAMKIDIPGSKIVTLRNGVDLNLFQPPEDRDLLRAQLGFSGPIILSVGYLIERKGHHLIIDAVSELDGVNLYIVGDGPDRKALMQRCEQRRVANRVHFLGGRSQEELRQFYGAADLLVLASSREGWANVLLEAMACGTPVLATRVWGTPEIVRDARAGCLTDRSVTEIGRHIRELLAHLPERQQVRAYAEEFSWDETSDGLYRLFKQVLSHP